MIPASEIPKITKIFPPYGVSEYERLYVEFESEHAADYVSFHARNIRKGDIHVGPYFPRMFQARFRALNKIAKSLREAPGVDKGDIKTKIVYGVFDLQLLSRTRNTRFTPVDLDIACLPDIQLDVLPPTSSPPKGRNRSVSASTSKRMASSPLQSDSKHARENYIEIVEAVEAQQISSGNSSVFIPNNSIDSPQIENELKTSEQTAASANSLNSNIPT